MRKSGRIESKKISDKKYLFKLPEQFTSSSDAKIAIYARVSTSKQKKDLENQISYLRKYVVTNGNKVENDKVFTDIASGMNEKYDDVKYGGVMFNLDDRCMKKNGCGYKR